MRLKYLELYGFKSFAEKTRFEFDEDFVGIVGPNGSGKSNTSDAIRWVLGEQSAKALRGSKMEDVIFSGTEKKAKMNMAQVTIGFDNSDASIDLPYNELSVSRKVYRSGESEYRINNAPVRRKDIRELFLDTGIGKEGYSIIGQGRIDDILSSRSEDRRAIFEEAAGIAKYKQRKDEANKRLDKTRENLDEVIADIRVKDKEAQMLKVQAENAKKGYELTQELEKHEISFLQKQVQQRKQKEEETKAELDKLHIDLKEAKQEFDQVNKSLEPYQESLEKNQEEIDALHSKENALQLSINKKEQDRSVKLEQLRFFEQDVDRLEAENKKLDQDIEKNQKDLETAQEKTQSLKTKQVELKEKFEKLSNVDRENQNQIKKDLEEKKNKINQYQSKLQYLAYDKESQEQADASLLALQKDLQNQYDNLLVEEESLKTDLENKEVQIKQTEEKQVLFEEQRKKTSYEITKLEKKLEDLRSQLGREENKASSLKSQAQMLKSMIENYEGYNRSVQRLLKAADQNPELQTKIVGVLADLIEVKSPYEDAVNVSLGGALQNIVVRDEHDASYLINYLKKHRLGRITFLPIRRIHGKKPVYTHEKEELINAVDAISCREELRGIIEHFLARTTIVNDLADANTLSYKFKGNRLVTLDGDIVNTWGSMIGGSKENRKNTSLINRNNQYDDLVNQLKSNSDSIKKIQSQGQLSSQERKEYISKQEELEEKIADNKTHTYQLEKEISEIKIKLDNLDDSKKRLEEDLSKKTSFSLEDYEKSVQEIREKLENLISEEASLEELYNNLRASDIENEKQVALVQSSMDFNQRESQLAENDEFRLEEELEAYKNQKSRNAENLKEIRANIDENKNLVEKLEKDKQASEEDLAKIKEAYLDLENQVRVLNANIEDELLKKEHLTGKISELEKSTYQLDLNLEHVKEQIEELYLNYQEQYDLSFEDVLDKIQRIDLVETTRAQVNKIRQELSKLGYFNYSSIDEYKTISEELNFLKKQMEDLKDSQEDIEELISNLDKTMEQMFTESFQLINEKYNEIFQILFQGGHARLRLNDGDVLTAGIEIEAQPPGKKLQSLDLLSGGERSMTALALLFAIFSIRPTPFCVLDEIDASLDEANIGRYVEYLQSLKDDTQFIVITHRKTTMELADMLYGVTMEDGITKVVSLKFEDYLAE